MRNKYVHGFWNVIDNTIINDPNGQEYLKIKVQQTSYQINIVITWKARTCIESAIIQLKEKTNMC